MSILVVGSVAFDSLETPSGKRDRVLGGAATHFALSASHFTKVRVVGVARVVDEHERVFGARVVCGLREPAERRANIGSARIAHQLDTIRGEPAQRDQHLAHSLGVVFGVTQWPILRPTRVRADEQRVALLGIRRLVRHDERKHEAGNAQHTRP